MRSRASSPDGDEAQVVWEKRNPVAPCPVNELCRSSNGHVAAPEGSESRSVNSDPRLPDEPAQIFASGIKTGEFR
jgi:hypothetical protein